MLLSSSGLSISPHIDAEPEGFARKDQFKFELKENEYEY